MAVLDAIGLLFFIIPGVIAFAVDFGNGAIYLPGGPGKRAELRKVRFDPKRRDNAALETMLRAKTGYSIRLDQENVKVFALKNTDELPERFLAVYKH